MCQPRSVNLFAHKLNFTFLFGRRILFLSDQKKNFKTDDIPYSCFSANIKRKFMWFFLSSSYSSIYEQKKFPIDNLAEWNHNKNPLGLRSMQVYVLVFDMGNLETFQVSFCIFGCSLGLLLCNRTLKDVKIDNKRGGKKTFMMKTWIKLQQLFHRWKGAFEGFQFVGGIVKSVSWVSHFQGGILFLQVMNFDDFLGGEFVWARRRLFWAASFFIMMIWVCWTKNGRLSCNSPKLNEIHFISNLFELHLQYCRSIREQILSSFTHRNFSIMVVGNKFDLVVDSPNYSQVRRRKKWTNEWTFRVISGF